MSFKATNSTMKCNSPGGVSKNPGLLASNATIEIIQAIKMFKDIIKTSTKKANLHHPRCNQAINDTLPTI